MVKKGNGEQAARRSPDLSYSYSTNTNQVKEENRFLKASVVNLEKELKKFQNPPFIVCEIRDMIDEKALIRLQNGNEFLVSVASQCKHVKAGDAVLAEQKNLTIIKKVNATKHFDAERFVIIEKPTIGWNQIGGLQDQEREIKEVIELPLKKPKLFKQIGIQPPKGILLYGPPGTGKTMLAKAVANSTESTFIQLIGSELVQKFIGEGAKLVKEIFQLARERAPSIIFIDELDAIASTRIDLGTSGEREVQRTFMQLLAEIDGFKPLDNVKIIGCTNRKDILDPALTRPGRLDRMIFVPLPSDEARKEIFKIHASKLNLDKNVEIDNLVRKLDGFSGAEIKSVITEAGYFAIRQDRKKVLRRDLLQGIEKVRNLEKENEEYKDMFC